MKIGLFLALYSDRTLEEALDAAVAAGCETVEIMSGSWSPHCRPGELLADPVARDRFATVVHERGLTISALSCHANPLHPDRGVAATATHAYRDTVRLAAELGVETVITFSGCPGESEHSLRPSWVTCSWPDEFPETLAWQWETRVLPYWAEAARFTRAHGVRIAIEPHPGFVVYNTASMLRLRETATDVIGVNFDPSHLFWQGMEPVACIRALGDAIFHVHAKDTGFHDELLAVNGVLEPIPGNRPAERSWIFRSVGVGHPVAFWRELVEALRASGYDGALSIEHEDPLLSQEEGLAVAVETLRAALDRGGDRVSTEVVVGLDVGTTGVKAVAVAPDGSIAAVAERGYPLSTPHAGWSEQDPEDWWTATRVVLAGVRAQIGAGGAIAGIGVSGQMHGLVALDSAGRVVRPAILWNDQRTAAECAEIEERIGLERLIALTGNRALPGFTAPKLLWLRRHEPDAYGRIARIMLPKDYVRLRLTGEWATDVADASGTLLLDVAQRSWSAEVLDALEIPSSWLPPVLESPEVSGNTLACDELSQGIPVAAGAGDCASAAVGVGIDRPGPLSIVMGTSGVVFAALPAFASDPEARVHAFCHAVPGQWHAMGVMLSAAGSLQWLHDRLAPGTPFADLVGEAGAWGPGVEGLLFAPYLAGERTPHADPSARAAFTGLELRHDRGALVRAVLEGVAFGLRDSLELVTTLGGPADRARASGGGARGLWLEIVASVLGVPIESTAVEEGSAYGAALLGGVAAGMFADVPDAVARCVRVLSTVEPNPAWRAAYDETYARFRALYPALDTVKERAE